MQRLDLLDEEKYVNAAFYGKSGTGKTSIGVTAPKPLILLSERQGIVHVKQAAKRLGKPVPPVAFMQSFNDYRNVLNALRGDKAQPFRVYQQRTTEKGVERDCVFELEEWPETVVVDSLTDCGRLCVEEIRRQSPPQKGKDGLPTDSQRFWNVLGDRMKNLILGFRDAPVHSVFLALADDREVGEDDDKHRQCSPDLPMRRLADVLSSAVNAIGYTYRKTVREPNKTTARIVYGVMTTGPEYMTLKPYRPLRDIELPDFSHWVNVINGSIAPDAVAAPAPLLAGGDVDAVDKPVEDTAETKTADETTTDTAPEAPAESKPAKRGKKQEKETEANA